MSESVDTPIKPPRKVMCLRLGNHVSLPVDGHGLKIGLALSVLIAALLIFSLTAGKYPISLIDILEALAGKRDDLIQMIVTEWRLPRVILAALLGAALGMSGAIFQSLTRNPLGSPDVIGFSAGSYSGALIAMLILSGGYYETALGSLAGGIATAATVSILSSRNGAQGLQIILIGIGISAMLSAFNAWMIREAELQIAMSAAVWGAGTLNGLGMEQLKRVALILLCVMPWCLILSRPMRQLEMGDDVARASGINTNRLRLALMALGVTLTATVTATAGPIAFIALCAPQLAQRLVRAGGVTLVSSALTGSVLLMAADWAAQHAFSTQFPVGVMTVSIGGIYFLWLLIREGRA